MSKPSCRIAKPLWQSASKGPKWWVSYLQANPLQSAFVFANVIGGVLLLIFFLQLHAMPELDLAGAVAVFQAVALTGLVLLVFLSISAFAGGLALNSLGVEIIALKKGMGAALLLMPTIAVMATIFYMAKISGSVDFSDLNYWVFGSVGAGALTYMLWAPGSSNPKWKLRFSYGITYFYFSFLWIVMVFMAGISFWTLKAPTLSPTEETIFLVSWLFWCVACNFGIAQQKNNNLGTIAVVSILSAFIFLFLTNNGLAFPKVVVRSLGLGELPVALVVTKDGCQLINQAAGQKVCVIEPSENSALVCPVVLRSRISAPYFIGLSPITEQEAWPATLLPERTATIAIPKSAVLSWSIIAPKSANQNLPDSTVKQEKVTLETRIPVATYLLTDSKNKWLSDQCGLPKTSSINSSKQ
jgi:hypothetical protein